jgi:apolipoprotein D and lipocalin family protein
MSTLKYVYKITVSLILILLTGCISVPDGISVIDNFELNRYMGKWYEIARLENHLEKGLSHVSAEYSINEDGSVKVLNSGYDAETVHQEQIEGKAYFVNSPQQGQLKVSFFGPFYASYNIIELDKQHYNYAMITGPDLEYLWILSRTPQLDKAVQDKLLEKAKHFGFATDQLIYVNQLLPK